MRSFVSIPAYVFISLRQLTPALRHPCIRLKPAPKGDRHVDVYPAVLPRCNPRTPSGLRLFARRNNLSQETNAEQPRRRNRHTGSLLHAGFGIWMKTQPFHLEVNNICLYIWGLLVSILCQTISNESEIVSRKNEGHSFRLWWNSIRLPVTWLDIVVQILMYMSEWWHFYRLHYLWMCAREKNTLRFYIVKEYVTFPCSLMFSIYSRLYKNKILIQISCMWVNEFIIMSRKTVNMGHFSKIIHVNVKYKTLTRQINLFVIVWYIIEDLHIFGKKKKFSDYLCNIEKKHMLTIKYTLLGSGSAASICDSMAWTQRL